MTDSIGVAICAFSDARWTALQEAVASVLRQSRPPDELVVVIDHNDGLLARATDAFPEALVVASEAPAGLSGARDTGVRRLESDIAAFLDDDACAEPDWLQTILAAFADERVIAVGGWVEPRWEEGAPRWLAPELYWVVGCSYRGLPPAVAEIRNPIGANMAFRRAALIELGGFPTELGRVGDRPFGDEETAVGIRTRERWPERSILHVPAARVEHVVPAARVRWRYLTSRAWAEGRSKARLTRAVGALAALESERRYTSRVLPAGMLRGLRDALRGDPSGLGRATSIVTGLLVTAAGYGFGMLTLLVRGP